MAPNRPIVLMLIAGSATFALADGPAAVTPGVVMGGTAPHEHVAHIYFNIATGERVATLIGDARPADTGASDAVWISDNTLPCAAFGQAAGTLAILDNPFPDAPVCSATSCTAPISFLDWGDIAFDTKVDCVGLMWATRYQDTDDDGDGIGDGVRGLAARWSWHDADNGFDTRERIPLAGLMLTDLPAVVGDTGADTIPMYTATVDLEAFGDADASFEIGDTDSRSDAGAFNPGAGVDLDADGLSDFSYSLVYIRPGSRDFDGDGLYDGVYQGWLQTGWLSAVPEGAAFQAADGTWGIDFDTPQGAEDAWDVFLLDRQTDLLWFAGTQFFGGFSCDADADGVTGDTVPFGQFYMNLYGESPGPACAVDLFPAPDGDGVLNFFDVNRFIGLFLGQDPAADLFPDGGDGRFNTFDISTFLTQFVAGCP